MSTVNPVPKEDEVIIPPTPEEKVKADAETENAFSDGFKNADGELPPLDPPAKKDEPADGEAPDPDAPPDDPPLTADATPKADAPLFAGKTEAEITGMFAKLETMDQHVSDAISRAQSESRKELDTLHGRIGSIQDDLKKLKPGQGIPKITRDKLKRLGANFPEVADDIAADFADMTPPEPEVEPEPKMPAAAARPVDTQAQVNEAVAAAVTTVREEAQTQILKILHPDYETLQNEAQFNAFLESLPKEKSAEYLKATDALVAGDCFTKYKSWKAKVKQSKTEKQTQLENAVVPKGGTGKPPSTAIVDEESGFLSGFKSAG